MLSRSRARAAAPRRRHAARRRWDGTARVLQLVDDAGDVRVTPEQQYLPGQNVDSVTTYKVEFTQVYVSKPTSTETDNTTTDMFPHEARLRNLTYAAPLYIDIRTSSYERDTPDEVRSASAVRLLLLALVVAAASERMNARGVGVRLVVLLPSPAVPPSPQPSGGRSHARAPLAPRPSRRTAPISQAHRDAPAPRPPGQNGVRQ